MTEHTVARVEDLSDGDRIVVQLEGREIGLFNLDGEYKAYLNWCAHQSGPICEGICSGTWENASFDRDSLEVELEWSSTDNILNCPWHGWEYDLTSGECLSKDGVVLPSYPVRVEGGDIIVSL